MQSDDDSVLSEVRQHHLMRVNDVLRRPQSYGRDEVAEHLLMESMAAVDGSLARWQSEYDSLRPRGAFYPTGVAGAYRSILPADAARCAATSIYAEIAHRLGWLQLDRALSEAEFRRVSAEVSSWVTQDRTLTEVVDAFGDPSVWIGGSNPHYPKTLVYTTEDHQHGLVCFHLWNRLATTSPGVLRGVHPEPMLLAVRRGSGLFQDSFSYTPEGLRRRPEAPQSAMRSTLWIFHGEHAGYASAVFETIDDGLAWAAEHQLTGILTEYPIGGTYDVAVAQGRFSPSQAHHGTPKHVAGFSPGLRHVHLTEGQSHD